MNNKTVKMNKILFEFNILVNLDFALFKYMQKNFASSDLIDKQYFNLNTNQTIELLLNREMINPLELLFPNSDTTSIYNELMSTKIDDILEYSIATDILGFCLTVNKMLSRDTSVTVWCKSKSESDFIKYKINPNINTIVIPNRRDLPIKYYDSIYMNYYPYVIEYRDLQGKYIYIANANYNMEKDKNIPLLGISVLVSDVNIVKTIDLYNKIKYKKEGNKNE